MNNQWPEDLCKAHRDLLEATLNAINLEAEAMAVPDTSLVQRECSRKRIELLVDSLRRQIEHLNKM